jgi:MoxR-vWA-beta-propeller ternary system domain bpX4
LSSCLIAATSSLHRWAFPGEAPKWNSEVSVWAANVVYQACQCLARRELDEKQVIERLSPAVPPCDAASTHYSADLLFRALPDLLRHARRYAQQDVLTQRLEAIASDWPLSSVGCTGLAEADLTVIVSHASLRRAYADRVVLRRDAQRARHPAIQAEIRAMLGLHTQLARDLLPPELSSTSP